MENNITDEEQPQLHRHRQRQPQRHRHRQPQRRRDHQHGYNRTVTSLLHHTDTLVEEEEITAMSSTEIPMRGSRSGRSTTAGLSSSSSSSATSFDRIDDDDDDDNRRRTRIRNSPKQSSKPLSRQGQQQQLPLLPFVIVDYAAADGDDDGDDGNDGNDGNDGDDGDDGDGGDCDEYDSPDDDNNTCNKDNDDDDDNNSEYSDDTHNSINSGLSKRSTQEESLIGLPMGNDSPGGSNSMNMNISSSSLTSSKATIGPK